MPFKHPILPRDTEALEKVQRLALKSVKGLRHVPYEAAFQQLRLLSLTYRLIRGDLIFMFKITLVFWGSPRSPPSPTQLTQGYAAMPISSHRRQHAFSIQAVHFGINYQL